MTDVRIEHADGSIDHVTHIRDETEREFDQQNQARIWTYRADAMDAGLELNDDEVYIVENGVDQFGGVLTDTISQGGEVELTVKSFMEFAKFAPPGPPKLPYENANDKTIITDAVDAVPDLSPGAIDGLETGIDIVFHHPTRALQIRLMRQLSKANVVYNTDKTVDYVESLGSDKTGTTISPANQNLTRSRIRDRAGAKQFNHLRMIGAGGTSVDVVADSFDSQTDTERWGRATFKEVSNVELLRRYGEALLSELTTPWQEVKASVTALSPSLGDTYHVEYPEEGIDADLRVTRLITRRDENGTHHDVWLSNRSFARSRPANQLEQRVSEAARTGQTSNTRNVPNINFPTTELPAGTYIDQGLILRPSEALHLWMVRISPLDSGVTAKLVRNGNVVYELPDKEHEATGSPLYTIDPDEFFDTIDFRLENSSASARATSAMFSYSVEKVGV